MKIKKLIIHNIASIVEATIDFEAEPLRSAEVFLITGRTGAGKSTILDSICLALYASTPRLVNSEMQGSIKEGDNEIRVTDPSQLMRRHTGFASSTLYFSSADNTDYEAVWSVQRAHYKPYGKIQGKKWTLTNLSTGHTLTKDKEIKAEILKAVGMDFNQFCRTTMLAQGEFTRFLNSKDNEKADILEKITGVDIYSRIGKSIYDITREKLEALQKAEEKIKDIHLLTPDEKDQLSHELDTLALRRKEISDGKTADEQLLAWLNGAVKLEASVKAAQQAVDNAETQVNSDAFKSMQQLIDRHTLSADARTALRNLDKEKRLIQDMQLKISGLYVEFQRFLGGHDFIIGEISDLDNKIGSLNKQLTEYLPLKEVFANNESLSILFDHISQIDNQEATLNQEIDLKRKLIASQLQPQKEKIASELQNLQSLIGKMLEESQSLSRQLEEAGLPKLRAKKEAAADHIHRLDKSLDALNRLTENTRRHQEEAEAIEIETRELEKKRAEAEANTPLLAEAVTVCRERKAFLNSIQLTVNDITRQLRASLKVGAECPVCGSTVTHIHTDESRFNQMVEKAAKSLEEAETNRDTIMRRLDQLTAAANQIEKNLTQRRDRFHADKSVETATKEFEAACLGCELKAETTTPELIVSLTTQYNAEIALLNKKIAEGEAIDTRLKQIINRYETAGRKKDLCVTSLANADNLITEANSKISAALRLIDDNRLRRADNLLKVKNYLGSTSWNADPDTQPQLLKKLVNKATDTYNNIYNKIEELNAKLAEARNLRDILSPTLTGILAERPDWVMTPHPEPQPLSGIKDKGTEIYRTLTAANAFIETHTTLLNHNRQIIDRFIEINPDFSISLLESLASITDSRLTDTRNEIKITLAALESATITLKSTTAQLAAHKSLYPDITPESCDAAVISERIAQADATIKTLSEQAGAIGEKLRQDQLRQQEMKTLIEAAELCRQEHTRWSRLDRMIGDATGSKFKRVAQSYVLASLINAANSYMHALSPRYTLAVEPGTFLISILDAYQSGARRATSTISGGESFLVSLALALALSDISRNLDVNLLFIDEGFGTLSGEPLQRAVETLRSLHTSARRRVGIISHIEELRERIPVQINVKMQPGTSHADISVTRL